MFAGCALLTVGAPLWLPVAALAASLPASRGAVRCGLFLTTYLWCETIGILVAAWLWLRYAAPTPGSAREAAYLTANYRLQCWWAGTLRTATERIFALRFTTEGDDVCNGPPAIVLPRHASTADTVIPLAFYAAPRRIRLRYVLKRELLFDPCLDIVGNRLPNCFVDRAATDSAPEVAAIGALIHGLGAAEGVLIYPEGTRFSTARRTQVLDSLRARGDAAVVARAERLQYVLPPRPAGTLALLAGNPGRDLLFCAHTGFEGSRDFLSLINGSWTGSHVRIRFFRVRYADIPVDAAEHRAFLWTLWERMDREVADLVRANTGR